MIFLLRCLLKCLYFLIAIASVGLGTHHISSEYSHSDIHIINLKIYIHICTFYIVWKYRHIFCRTSFINVFNDTIIEPNITNGRINGMNVYKSS